MLPSAVVAENMSSMAASEGRWHVILQLLWDRRWAVSTAKPCVVSQPRKSASVHRAGTPLARYLAGQTVLPRLGAPTKPSGAELWVRITIRPPLAAILVTASQ